jgi:hypothetical protein
MSGSGSGGGGGNLGGGAGIPNFDCNNVSIKTNITSPNASILKTVVVGDFLDIELQSATGPLIAKTIKGKILGSVFITNPILLIECISNGHHYQARVLKIDGGECQILITPK